MTAPPRARSFSLFSSPDALSRNDSDVLSSVSRMFSTSLFSANGEGEEDEVEEEEGEGASREGGSKPKGQGGRRTPARTSSWTEGMGGWLGLSGQDEEQSKIRYRVLVAKVKVRSDMEGGNEVGVLEAGMEVVVVEQHYDQKGNYRVKLESGGWTTAIRHDGVHMMRQLDVGPAIEEEDEEGGEKSAQPEGNKAQARKGLVLRDGEGKVFGVRVEDLKLRKKVPLVLHHMVEALQAVSAHTHEGVFRVPGHQAAVDALRESIDNAQWLGVRRDEGKAKAKEGGGEGGGESEHDDAHSLASLLKLWLRELPAPLISEAEADAITRAIRGKQGKELSATFKKQVAALHEVHGAALICLVRYLQLVCEHTQENKMDPNSLATVFAPCLLHSSASDPASIMRMQDHTAMIAKLITFLPCQDRSGLDALAQQFAALFRWT